MPLPAVRPANVAFASLAALPRCRGHSTRNPTRLMARDLIFAGFVAAALVIILAGCT